jgi:hypothetical protein
MGVFDKVREFAEHLSESDDGPAKGSPAAAAGGSVGGPGSAGQGGQVSEAGSSFVPATPDATPSTRLDTGGEDKPKHEDRRSEDVAGVSPSENVPNSERDDV